MNSSRSTFAISRPLHRVVGRQLFGRFKQVKLLGEDVTLVAFDLNRYAVIAVCRKGKRKVRATLDSIEFPDLTPTERLWLQAWKKYSAEAG